MSDVDAAEVKTDMWGEPEESSTFPAATVPDDAPAAVEANPAEGEDKPARRTPLALEEDVRQVCNDYVTGTITLGEGKFLTPHAIATYIGEKRGGKEHRPSSGAVQATLKRWELLGYIKANQKPFAFDDYTTEGQTKGIAALKAEYSERAKAGRAAAKAAAAPVAEPVTQEPATF